MSFWCWTLCASCQRAAECSSAFRLSSATLALNTLSSFVSFASDVGFGGGNVKGSAGNNGGIDDFSIVDLNVESVAVVVAVDEDVAVVEVVTKSGSKVDVAFAQLVAGFEEGGQQGQATPPKPFKHWSH